jgi:hypothetical protein
MKMRILAPILCLVAIGITSCTKQQVPAPQDPAAPPPVTSPVLADHIDLSEQEMYTACSECHADETPEIHDAWFNSTHGIANVKCYQCHGTYEDMERVPDMARCEFCHTDKIDNHGDRMACWQCHPAHRFTGHQ